MQSQDLAHVFKGWHRSTDQGQRVVSTAKQSGFASGIRDREGKTSVVPCCEKGTWAAGTFTWLIVSRGGLCKELELGRGGVRRRGREKACCKMKAFSCVDQNQLIVSNLFV